MKRPSELITEMKRKVTHNPVGIQKDTDRPVHAQLEELGESPVHWLNREIAKPDASMKEVSGSLRSTLCPAGSTEGAEPAGAGFNNSEEAKAYVLDNGPIAVPKRFLFERTLSSQRIESIAARLIYRDMLPWKGVLDEYDQKLLLYTFGLELVCKAGKYVARRKFHTGQPPLRAIHALEKLWDAEYETALRLREERQAVLWIRSKQLEGKDQVGDRLYRETRARLNQWRERLRLIVLQEHLLIERIAFPDERRLNELVETDFLELPQELWSRSMSTLLRIKRVPDWLITERIRSATAILEKFSWYGESALHMEGSLQAS